MWRPIVVAKVGLHAPCNLPMTVDNRSLRWDRLWTSRTWTLVNGISGLGLTAKTPGTGSHVGHAAGINVSNDDCVFCVRSRALSPRRHAVPGSPPRSHCTPTLALMPHRAAAPTPASALLGRYASSVQFKDRSPLVARTGSMAATTVAARSFGPSHHARPRMCLVHHCPCRSSRPLPALSDQDSLAKGTLRVA